MWFSIVSYTSIVACIPYSSANVVFYAFTIEVLPFILDVSTNNNGNILVNSSVSALSVSFCSTKDSSSWVDNVVLSKELLLQWLKQEEYFSLLQLF